MVSNEGFEADDRIAGRKTLVEEHVERNDTLSVLAALMTGNDQGWTNTKENEMKNS